MERSDVHELIGARRAGVAAVECGVNWMIKELTASTFVVAVTDRWRVGLIVHPRMGVLIPAGGHVEPGESPAEAAVREVLEESGLAVRLWPGPAMPLPEGFPHPPTAAPWWMVEMAAAPDSHTREPHVHVDFAYVAVAEAVVPVRVPECDVRWLDAAQVAETPGISEDSRLQAKQVLVCVADRDRGTPPYPSGAA